MSHARTLAPSRRTMHGRLGRAVLLLGCLFAAALAAFVAWPLPAGMVAHDPAPAVVVQDRHGVPLRVTRAQDGSRSRWIPLAEMDPDIIAAFVAVEDRRFFSHPGVDAVAAARALRDNLAAGRVVSGASTITMQTARLLRGTPRSWRGKVAQALWALRIELRLDRQQILEQYLNRVQLGQGAVGVGAASQLYFGASAGEVSLGQAAMLAGIARSPSTDNPFSSIKRARARREMALRALREAGYASEGAAQLALRETLATRPRGVPFLAPHFTTQVLEWAADGGSARGVLRTSLDLELQRALESEVRHTVAVLGDRGARHAAAVVLDNRSGEILAWVGSPDFWADTSGQADMVVSARQPGSALKPFLYGLAFDRGFTAASVLADVPRVYATSTGPYRPRNYDHRFHGPVRAREALASSYNVTAVELAEQVGAGNLLHTLRAAGFESLRRSAEFYGLGLALGNGDVTLLELANAYRALANGGVWAPYRWRAADGASRWGQGSVPSRRVTSAQAAALVLDVLSDAEARVPGFGVETPFDFPFPVAVKTGTSRHFTDNWAVAATAAFTVAVWVGNFSGRPMEGVSGVTGAGPLLHRAVMVAAARRDPGVLISPPEAGLVPVRICRLSGLRATSRCPQITEWFVPGTGPSREDDWHREGGVVLPARYAEWSQTEAGGGAAVRRVALGVPVPPAAGDSRFRILSPLAGDRYEVPPDVDARYATVGLRAAGGSAAGAVRWFVNGRRVAGSRMPLVPGEHVIRAEGAAGEVEEVRIVVEGRAASR